jgi:hypothetical protein
MTAAILAESTGSAAHNGSAAASPRGVPGDGGTGGVRQLPVPSSLLTGLKRERNTLRKQLERLQEARVELEEPSRVLADIEAEQQSLELETAEAIAAWAAAGCAGARPALDPAARLSDIAKRLDAARKAVEANAVPLAEVDSQMVTLRQRLAALDGEIASGIAVVLADELEGELAGVRAAADELNAALARVMGLRVFALSHRGTPGFMRLVEQLLALQTPVIGSTKIQIEVAAAEWRSKFAEMVR